MPFELEKPFSRLWSINAGKIMVVTDLHGDWDAFQRYRDRFLDLHDSGQADCLIFCGDLIHSESEDAPDHSLEIVLNVIELQQSYGEVIITLCGNHELPHIYEFGLSKGKREYTPAFESALSRSGQRPAVTRLFSSLPFFIRTAAGVSITHAGASPDMVQPQNAKELFDWDHEKELAEAETRLADVDIEGMRRAYAKLSQAASYDSLARHYLAVTDVDDPRYDGLLRGLFATSSSGYQRLHAALFTKCEQEYGERAYASALEGMLQALSRGYLPQKVLVAGHMTIEGGHQVIAGRHLRLASGCHATPPEAGEYLLFDSSQRVEEMAVLKVGLYSVFESA
jgi:hypothetical protein